jgi:tRNA-dihydrouridine synthase
VRVAARRLTGLATAAAAAAASPAAATRQCGMATAAGAGALGTDTLGVAAGAGAAAMPSRAPSVLAAAAAAAAAADAAPPPPGGLPPFSPTRAAAAGDVISVAPMMEWTDRNYRYLMRLLTSRTLLYTEMVVDATLRHAAAPEGYLRFHAAERPLACQLGGSDPASLAAAAVQVQAAGYDEINLNCGCPSPKVAGKGAFGAALMFTPEVVRDAVAAMRAAVTIPVTVKCRLGADGMDSYAEFARFVDVVASGGCTHFIVHARKCLLKGLGPKGNRTVPPLKYAWVQRVALERPHLRFSLNGGIVGLDQVEALLSLRRGGGGAPPPDVLEAAMAVPAPQHAPRRRRAGDGKPEETGASAAAAPNGGGCAADAEDDGAGDDGGGCCDGGGGDAAGAGGAGGRGRAGSAASAGSGDAAQAAGDAGGAGAPGVPREDARARFFRLRAAGEAAAAEARRLPAWQFAPGVEAPPAGTPPDPSSYGSRTAVLDSIMIGRAAYNNPWMFADVDRRLFGVPNVGLSRREVIAAYLDYADTVADTVPPNERGLRFYRPMELVKPLLSLFAGEYGGGKYRTALSAAIQGTDGRVKVGLRDAVAEALRHIPEEVLDARPPV